MATETSIRRPSTTATRVDEVGVPASRVRPLRVLMMADAQGTLYAEAQLLPTHGWPVSMVFEEGHAMTNVLAHIGGHNLLVVRSATTSSFNLGRFIERLRQLGYDGCITYCARVLTLEISAGYKAISVDRCLEPPTTCTTLVRVVEWLQGPVAPPGPGLSIFEM